MAPGLHPGSEREAVDGSTSNANKVQPKPLCQIVTPVGMLGYGFDEELNRATLKQLVLHDTPIALILDSGSTDSGPEKLALGTMTVARSNYERDIRKLLALSHEFNVPIIISSAGGSGTDAHVDEFLDIIQEVCEEFGNRYLLFSPL